jgi:hypothetical protein
MTNLLSFAIGFFALGVVEAIVKPLATWVVRKQTDKWLPQLLNALEPIVPQSIGNIPREELERIILDKYAEITGQPRLTPIEQYNVLRRFEREYSPLIASEKLMSVSDRRFE